MIFIYNSLKFSDLVLNDNLIIVFEFILKTFKLLFLMVYLSLIELLKYNYILIYNILIYKKFLSKINFFDLLI